MQIAVGFLDFCAVGHLSGRIVMGDFQKMRTTRGGK